MKDDICGPGNHGEGTSGKTEFACLFCPFFPHGPLLRQFDACLDAIEVTAAAVPAVPRGAATRDGRACAQKLNRHLSELRAQVDALAISVIENARCCRCKAGPQPQPEGFRSAAPVQQECRPQLSLVPPAGPRGSAAPAARTATRLRCV